MRFIDAMSRQVRRPRATSKFLYRERQWANSPLRKA